MTLVDTLILLLENFEELKPLAQLGTVTSCIGVLSGSIFWAWRKGRKYAVQLVETNGKLKQELKDSTFRTKEIERQIEEHRRTLAILQAQVPAAILARAVDEKAHTREILSELFNQLAPAVATCCREMAEVELALTVDAGDLPHLQLAERLAQTADLLTPEGEGALRDLLAEVNAIYAVWQEEQGASPTAETHWNAAFDYVGGGGPDVAIPLMRRLNETGMRRYREGHYATAVVLLRRAVLLAHRNLRPEHPDVATSLNNLAVLYEAQGRYAAAEPLFLRAIAVCEKTLGLEHPNTATWLNNLASLYREIGRLAEAELLYQRVLSILEKTLGLEHPNTATVANNLATLYYDTGRYPKAESLHQRTLAIRQKALGLEHPDVAQSLNNLANLYQDTGRPAEAELLYQRAIAIHEKILPPDHPHRMQGRENYARLLDQLGRPAEAAELRAPTLAIR